MFLDTTRSRKGNPPQDRKLVQETWPERVAVVIFRGPATIRPTPKVVGSTDLEQLKEAKFGAEADLGGRKPKGPSVGLGLLDSPYRRPCGTHLIWLLVLRPGNLVQVAVDTGADIMAPEVEISVDGEEQNGKERQTNRRAGPTISLICQPWPCSQQLHQISDSVEQSGSTLQAHWVLKTYLIFAAASREHTEPGASSALSPWSLGHVERTEGGP